MNEGSQASLDNKEKLAYQDHVVQRVHGVNKDSGEKLVYLVQMGVLVNRVQLVHLDLLVFKVNEVLVVQWAQLDLQDCLDHEVQ